MSKVHIIGIAGSAGAGKTYLANQIVQYASTDATVGKVSIKRFAGILKTIARRYYFWDGEKDARGRRLLQVLGTEAGREYDEDIWVKHMRVQLLKCLRGHKSANEQWIIIDDVRFDNEATMILELGGIIILKSGGDGDPMMKANSAHASEAGIAPSLATLTVNRMDGNYDLTAVVKQIKSVFAKKNSQSG